MPDCMLDEMFVYRDRYAAPGEAPINLNDLAPDGFPAAASWSILSGNSAGHFALSGSTLDFSTAGDTANMSAGTYTLVIQGTWTIFNANFNTHTATLTVECPPDTRYVDPVAGSDAANGTSKATAWKNLPGDPNATGNAASFTSLTTFTLISIKGGSVIRAGNIAPGSNRFAYASDLGWNGRTRIVGTDPLPAGTAATSGDVTNNPNVANIKRYDLGFQWKRGQFLTDAGQLVQIAQWPAAGADPFTDAQDPSRHLAGGMFRYPGTDYTQNGTVVTLIGAAAAGILAEFGSRSLVGYTVWQWSGSPQEVAVFQILSHDTATGQISFDVGSAPIVVSGGQSAFQIVGHPYSIKAANQFAGKLNDTFIFAWLANGTAPEIMVRKRAFDGGLNLGLYGIDGEGYYNENETDQGAFVSNTYGSDFTHKIARLDIRWIVNDATKSACIRTAGGGSAVFHILNRNKMRETVRASGIRYSNNRGYDMRCVANYTDRITRTGMYFANQTRYFYRGNRVLRNFGAHGNGPTFYNTSTFIQDDGVIEYNETQECTRQIMKDPSTNVRVRNNWFEQDSKTGFSAAVTLSDTDVLDRNVFIRSRNGATPNGYSCTIPNATTAGSTATNNVFDGIGSTAVDANGVSRTTFTNCLVTRAISGTGIDDEVVAGTTDRIGKTGSGNKYIPISGFDGTLTPEMKATLGVGRIGYSALIYDVATVSFAPLINQQINTVVMSEAKVVSTTDATRSVTVTNGEFRTADNAAMTTNVSGWASSGTYAQGKYIQLRRTSSPSYDTGVTTLLDLGGGNTTLWSVKTQKAKDIPWVSFDTSDTFITGSTGLGANSAFATFAFKGRFNAYGATATLFGPTAGNLFVFVQLLSTGAFRFNLRNSANVSMAITTTPVMAANTDLDVLFTADTTKATAAEALKCWINGSEVTLTTSTYDGTIGPIAWSSANVYRFGNLIVNGDVGYFYASNRWVDISQADIRERFSTGRRIGTNGDNVDGSAPLVLLLGTEAQWEDAAGISRGTGPKFVKQSGTDVVATPGTATAWPSYTFATALTVSAPSSIALGDTADIVVSANGATMNNYAVTLNAGGQTLNGTLVNSETPSLTLPYTPTSAGAKSLSATATGLTTGTGTLGVVAAEITYNFTINITDNGVTTPIAAQLVVA